MLSADPADAADMPPLADWAALLRSWCAHLEHSASLSVVRVAAVAGTAADVNNSVLGVNVAITPTDATLSHNSVRLIREAVELLAALAHVDNSAWRFLLQRHCGCSGMPHDDTFLPPRFMVGFGKNWYSATALDTRFFDQFFFGTVRDRNRTDAYAQAMKAIYAKMPVTVRRDFPDRYHRRCRYFISLSFKPPVHMESAERVIAYFKSLRTLVKSIAEASVSYRDGGDREEELDQSISMHDMTFPFENCYMLEGMRLKITRIDVPPRGTALIAELMAQGVEFTPEIDVYQESAFRAITVANNGPILMGIVDSARLSKFLVVERVLPAKAYKFHEVHVDNSAISKETFYYDPDTRRFQALCSALAISQDVDELYLNNLFYNDDYAARSHKWRWLAYALFSNSAFSSPKITSLVLAEYSFRERDMAAIQSVLAARFPVRMLLDRVGISDFFDENDSDEDDELHSSMDVEREQKTKFNVERLVLNSGTNSGETQNDAFIQSTDDQDDMEYDVQREQVRHSSTPYVEMFMRSSQERLIIQPHYRSHVPGEAAVNNATGVVDAVVDDDAGVVFLKEGAVVFVNPFDLEEKGKPPEPLVLRHDSCFPIICNDEWCQWIDILVPCFGYCAVPRVLVDRIGPTPAMGSNQSSLSRGYTGSIRSLELHFKVIDSVERSVLPLLQYLGSQLTSLTFSNKVTDNLDVMGQLLEACPHIRTFVTETAPLQFETMLLAAYETGACQIESLVVDAFSVEPKHTLAFIVTLQDSRSALARKLRKLSLHTTRAAPFGAMELSGFLEVLRQNKTLMALQLTVLSSLWKEFEPQLMSFDGELVPVEKQPLPVRCRLAFLSAMRVHGSSWNENVASKREQRGTQERSHKRQRLGAVSVDFTRLDRGVVLLIFQFAAERESRSIRVVKMPTHLDEEAEYEDHLENAGDFS